MGGGEGSRSDVFSVAFTRMSAYPIIVGCSLRLHVISAVLLKERVQYAIFSIISMY
jgi:hypothetical protein